MFPAKSIERGGYQWARSRSPGSFWITTES
nr:MAG TPA: hypothetical protein [Caudoviricetes sp.]